MTGLFPKWRCWSAAQRNDRAAARLSLGGCGQDRAQPRCWWLRARGVAVTSRCGDAHPADPNSRSTAQHLRPPLRPPQQLPRTTVPARSKLGLEGSWGSRRPQVGLTGPCTLAGEEVGWALSSLTLEIMGSLCPAPYTPKGGKALSSSLSGLASHTRPGQQQRYFLLHPQEHQEAPQPQILACGGQRGGSEQRPVAVLPCAAPASKTHSTGKS